MHPVLATWVAALVEVMREGGPVVWALVLLSVLGWVVLLRLAMQPFEEPPAGGQTNAGTSASFEHILWRSRAEEELADGFASLRMIALLATAAPLLGLLGTVFGMMETFAFLGGGDVPRIDALAGGISKALLTTQTGLVVALLLLAGHAFLQRRLQRREHELGAA